MKYPTLQDGEWVRPVRRKFKMICCDCGLVHDTDFRIVGKHIEFRSYRNYRSTGQIRRNNGKKKLEK